MQLRKDTAKLASRLDFRENEQEDSSVKDGSESLTITDCPGRNSRSASWSPTMLAKYHVEKGLSVN